jgi:two-component sensor histidine kinase
MAVALRENRPIRGAEALAERPDGTRVPFIPYPTPLRDVAGTLVGAVNMLVDITERKRAEERQALLVRELHHRVRNTLATVQAIMSSTAHASSSIDEFKQAFMGRIACLSKTHALLTDDRDQAVSFRDLLASELDAFDDGSARRIRLTGPQIELPSRLAVPLGMAVHELTTNAAKYGALSEFGGAVEVRWSRMVAADGEKLDCTWRERNGPAVQEPKRRGFGSRLLHHVLEAQTRAEVTIDYRPDGLRCRLVVPLSAG